MLTEFLITVILMISVPLWEHCGLPLPAKTALCAVFALIFMVMLFRGGKKSDTDRRLRRLGRGCSLMRLAVRSAAAGILLFILYNILFDDDGLALLLTYIVPTAVVLLTGAAGVLRIAVSSRQLRAADHILMLTTWYFPFLDIIPLRTFYKKGYSEYIAEKARIELDAARAENEICRTKYPILLVHGIFFRDWQLMNYWGRIPAALIKNGADIHYGKQQSSNSLRESASELVKTIQEVLAETGASKVNIIAHSKGGLDSRYAISCLGADKYVASLTTVNTPHKGCDMVDFLLDKVPAPVKSFLERKYNSVFAKLGDTSPDFMAGVNALSAKTADGYDILMPDMPGVVYSSYMTVMNGMRSAGFPLNIGYLLIKKLNGENDGLVWEGSAAHGKYTLVKHDGKRGISHGDVIDLFRENISGYDVREFYTGIVSSLKSQGL